MTISRAPIARRDYESAAIAAAFAGVLCMAGAGWLFVKIAHLPGSYIDLVIYVIKHGNVVSHKSQIILFISFCVGLFAAAIAFYLAAQDKHQAVVHAEGGQVKGVGAAKQMARNDPSQTLFSAGGIPFTRDRIRRSVLVLGSIGGGKTQAIWHVINGLIETDHKILVIDGPKGDFSRCWPTDFMLIAPWHSGASWDIAADCPTRNHAMQLAAQIIPANDKDPMWSNAAQSVLVAVLCSLQVEFDDRWGWGELYERLIYTPEELKELAAQYYPPAVQALFDAESKTTGSILINLTAFMSPVFEISLAWKNTTKKFSFLQWWSDDKSEIKTVILQGSAEFQKVSNAYISGILALLASKTASASFAESKTRQNIIILDEFAQLPRINGVEKFIEIGRSKGCSLIIGTQSLAQIRKIYGQDDMQAWSSMIGTKVFGRVSGADDIEMVIREIGEKEVFRRTETISSNGTGAGGSASVGWAKEKVHVVLQSHLENLGPDKKAGGCKVLIKGFGGDMIETVFSFISMPEKRDFCITNPMFNQHINIQKQTMPANSANTPEDVEFTEIAGTDAPQQVHAEHADNTPDEFNEHLLILQTAEPLATIDEFSDHDEGEHTENMMDEIGQDAINSGFSDVAGDVLGVDGHVVELGLELTELLDSDASKQAVGIEVAAVVDGEKNAGKRKLFKKRNQAKHGVDAGLQEVQQ